MSSFLQDVTSSKVYTGIFKTPYKNAKKIISWSTAICITLIFKYIIAAREQHVQLTKCRVINKRSMQSKTKSFQ